MDFTIYKRNVRNTMLGQGIMWKRDECMIVCRNRKNQIHPFTLENTAIEKLWYIFNNESICIFQTDNNTFLLWPVMYTLRFSFYNLIFLALPWFGVAAQDNGKAEKNDQNALNDHGLTW